MTDPTEPSKYKAPQAPPFLENMTERLRAVETLQPGSILLRLTGKGGGDYCLNCFPEGIELSPGLPRTTLLVEIMAKASTLRAILEGKKDARRQMLAGGMRVRGDLRYLSDLALALGLIDEPL